MPQGKRLTTQQIKMLRRMIRQGYKQRAIMDAVGCSAKTVYKFRHIINGTKPRATKKPQDGLLTKQQVAEIGIAEADRILAEQKMEIDFLGFYDSVTGKWHPPRFAGYLEDSPDHPPLQQSQK